MTSLQTKRPPQAAAHSSTEPVETANPSSENPPDRGREGIARKGHTLTRRRPNLSMLLMHNYATAWAGSVAGDDVSLDCVSRVRFIPVSPGSNKWTFRR